MYVHVLFSVAPLFATCARAHAHFVFTGSTFTLLIFLQFQCFCNHFRLVFLILKVIEKPQLKRWIILAISNKPVDTDSSLINGQRFDLHLPFPNSKPVLNLSKVGFLIYLSLAVNGGEIKESYSCEQRFLSSLTEKKEQGTSFLQGNGKYLQCTIFPSCHDVALLHLASLFCFGFVLV